MNNRFSRKGRNRPDLRLSVTACCARSRKNRCPECFAAVVLLVTGIVSTSGVAAVAAKLFRDQKPLGKVLEVRIPKVKKNSK